MADRIDRTGQRVGDYHLLRRLGSGSFGDVYLGEHGHTHVQAVVKILHERLQGDELKNFRNELRPFQLRHPHIIQLLDFGVDSDNVPYLVMDYAPHGTLRDKHPGGTQLPLSTILSYVAPLASALQYAHDRQLIHRDVKPENMLLDAYDEVLLGDFGVAAVSPNPLMLGAQEAISGTLPYMAPEQLRGNPCPASDQYSLGIVVYEWLTGNLPFTGTTLDVVMHHYTTPPAPLRDQLPTLSADVEQVVLTALAKKPEQRFASIAAFARALQQASEGTDLDPTPRIAPPPAYPNVLTLPGTATPAADHSEMTEAAFAPVMPPSAALPEGPPSRPARRGIRSVQPFALFLIGLAILVIIGGTGLAALAMLTPAHNAHTITTAQSTATAAALSTSTAVASNPAAGDSIMFGFNVKRTRDNPFEHILSPTTVSGLRTAWTSDPTGSFIGSSPAVVNGVVYVGSNDRKLYAYKAVGCGASVCAPLWSSNSTGGVISSSPAVVNGVVYVGSNNHKLYAYKAAGCGARTCAPLWSSKVTGGAIRSSPVIVNGVVYVGSDDHKLYAYKAAGCGARTCAPLWSSDPAGGLLYSSPAVANGVVYIGSDDHKLYVYKAAGCGTGTCPPLWTSDPTGNLINSSPAVANSVVYISSHDKKLYAYNAEGCGASICAPLWSSKPLGGYIYSSPAVAKGFVYVSSHDKKLYAFRAAGCGASICAPLWSSKPTGNWITSSPMVANGVVYVGSDDHKLYAYEAAGCGARACAPLWSSNPTGGWITSSPTVVDGVVYVGSDDHRLYAFHL